MLFTVKKENIIEGLQKAAGIIPTRAGAAYLRSLWIKAEGEVLTIMATDANIEFTGTRPELRGSRPPSSRRRIAYPA